ncbi:MAG: hypothetical protein ABSF67_15130 [Roseiarcus sp.]|jgi:hypothetical protein
MGIKITLDVREFEQLLTSAASQIPKALRATVTKVARDARRTALNVASRDMDVTASRAKTDIPLVSAARLGNLSATWRIPKARVQATDTIEVGPAIRKGPVAMGVELLTGGRSTAVLLPRGFVIRGKSSGKPILFSRNGPGRWGTLQGAKQIFGEMTRTSMAQEDGAARLAWEKDAEAQMKIRTTEAVAAALAGSRSIPSEGSD